MILWRDCENAQSIKTDKILTNSYLSNELKRTFVITTTTKKKKKKKKTSLTLLKMLNTEETRDNAKRKRVWLGLQTSSSRNSNGLEVHPLTSSHENSKINSPAKEVSVQL